MTFDPKRIREKAPLPDALPCPWCSNAVITLNGAWVPGKKLCICRECHACGPAEASAEEAVKQWNRVARWAL